MFCLIFLIYMFLFSCFETPSRFANITPIAVFAGDFLDYIGLLFGFRYVFGEGNSCCSAIVGLLETFISCFRRRKRRTRVRGSVKPFI